MGEKSSLAVLASIVDAGEGSLGGAEFDGTHEQQVAGLNELIASEDPEKTDTLQHLLNIEGLYIAYGVLGNILQQF